MTGKIFTRLIFSACLFLSCVPQSRITGSLIICGGGELPQNVYDRFLELAGGNNARIVIIPTASEIADHPKQNLDIYWEGKSKLISATILHTRNRAEANLPEFIQPLKDATGVWISGGKQQRLTNAYLDTLVEKELKNLLKRGGVIGGTSAGASVLSSIMIVEGDYVPIMGRGFHLLDTLIERPCIIDQHFDTRNRIARLLRALKSHPEALGLGIGRGAAILINKSGATVINKNVWLCNADEKSKKYGVGDKINFNYFENESNH